MEFQLEQDLSEVLEGLDPLQTALQDPILAGVVEEVFNTCEDDIDSASYAGKMSRQCQRIQVPLTTSKQCQDSVSTSFEKETQNTLAGVKDDAYASPQELPQSKYNHKCVCCGRPARGFYYFGVIVCNGCKVFFARSVKDSMYKSYMCMDGCEELPTSSSKFQIKCQHCRFKRLCELGMRVPKKHGCHYKNQVRQLLVNSIELSLEESRRVEKITVMVSNMGRDLFGKLAHENVQVLKDYLSFLYHGTRIPQSTLKLTFDYLLFSFKKILEQKKSWLISGNLSSKDINRLIVANYPLCQELLEASKMNESYNGEIEGEIDAIVVGVKEGLNLDDKNKVNQIHSDISKGGTAHPVKKTYEMVYSPDELGITMDIKTSQQHRWLVYKMRKLPYANWDTVAMILNMLVIIFTPDFIQLDDAKEAERLQVAYASLLHKYLKDKRNSSADSIFRESMLAISYARELKDIRGKALAKCNMNVAVK